MNLFLANLGRNAFSISCVVAAAVMAANGVYGWGWVFLVAALTSGYVGKEV